VSGSFWKPSRVPTSRMLTGSAVMAPSSHRARVAEQGREARDGADASRLSGVHEHPGVPRPVLRSRPVSASPIPIVGGTGALGFGLALRLARAGHEVVIGSRDAGRAEEAAARVRER